MKSFIKKLLFILPLLIFVSCEEIKDLIFSEDSIDDSEYLSVNEWVKCKQLGVSSLSSDGQLLDEHPINWNGNIATYHNGDIAYFNEYGFITRLIPSDSHAIYITNYIDKWKEDYILTLSMDGDTIRFENFEWDGLTRTWIEIDDDDGSTYTVVHNKFGKELSSERIWDDGSYIYWEFEYMDDQRRELIAKSTLTPGGELDTVIEWIWDGNQCRVIHNPEILFDYQYDITLNEYFEIISRTFYNRGDFVNSYSYEYECPGFEQIYP